MHALSSRHWKTGVAAGLSIMLAACTIPPDTSPLVHENPTVAESRKILRGLGEADIRMCAGFPSATVRTNDSTEIWTYVRQISRGNVNVSTAGVPFSPVPGLAGSVGLGSTGDCRAQFRMEGGKVRDVEFAGDNNTMRSRNALCSTIIDGCVMYARRLQGKTPSVAAEAGADHPR
jgi:hypothetical protein